MRISDWSSDVCSSDLQCVHHQRRHSVEIRIDGRWVARGVVKPPVRIAQRQARSRFLFIGRKSADLPEGRHCRRLPGLCGDMIAPLLQRVEIMGQGDIAEPGIIWRSEEHTSELQSLMRISYAVFCLKKKKQ